MRSIGFIALAGQVTAIALLRMRFTPTRTRALVDPSVRRDYPFLMLALPVITIYAGMYIPRNYLSAFAVESGLTGPNLGFYMIAIMNASSILGRLVVAAIADSRLGIVNTAIVALFVHGVLCFIWIGVDSRIGVVMLAVALGIIGGGTLSLISLVPVSFTKDSDYIGTRLGMFSLLGGFGLLWGSPVAGSLINKSPVSYINLEIYSGVLLTASAVLLAVARVMHTGLEPFVKF
jgi:hypothetical protein